MQVRLMQLIREANEKFKDVSSESEKERLMADYLLDNGVLALPCKKGDIAYRLAHGYVYQERVRCVHVTYLTDGYGFTPEDIGKVAFIGHDAQEKAKNTLAKIKEAQSNGKVY